MKAKTKKPTWKPSLGSFSKAVPGAISLNFGESGGVNCSTKCEALKLGVCYAVHTEKMKPSIQTSGERKRKHGFAKVCLEYRNQIERLESKGKAIPWIRFSTFGSVPNRRLTGVEMQAFADLVRSFPPGVPVHFPVETKEKAERFRAIAVAFDLSLVVRESCQSDRRANETLAENSPSSRIVYKGANKRERLANAQKLARKSKGKARVCPAIASTILRRDSPVKCGQCTLCARGDVNLILYPQH
jgi:hypothetical protein